MMDADDIGRYFRESSMFGVFLDPRCMGHEDAMLLVTLPDGRHLDVPTIAWVVLMCSASLT